MPSSPAVLRNAHATLADMAHCTLEPPLSYSMIAAAGFWTWTLLSEWLPISRDPGTDDYRFPLRVPIRSSCFPFC